MDTGERIRSLRKARGMTLEELGKRVGVQKAAINKYETGRVINLKRDVVAKLATALGVTPEYLLGFNESDSPLSLSQPEISDEELVSFPVIGNIAAGFDALAVEEATGETELIPGSMLRGHRPDDFLVLRVQGDSMYPLFLDGDRVLVRRCTSVDSGSVAVVMYNGDDATVKRLLYAPGEDWLELRPINPEYKPRRIEGAELEQCRVIGQVVKLIRDIE